jgi:AraC-like DNA-binding protein
MIYERPAVHSLGSVQNFLDFFSPKGIHASRSDDWRLFKECAGVGIKEYRMKRHLETAAHQLRTTNPRVRVIAKQAGYRHVSTFSRYFLKQFHIRPTDFRSYRPKQCADELTDS